ncbi:MAG TPA: DUF1800 domain-containing protein [Planctomycetaceae bacterium]|nr:DUF1800 domain-containing protein [Planctomycetaceae bacterium]
MNPVQETLDHLQPDAAWQPFVPDSSNPWNDVKVAHLYRRSGFGTNWATIATGVQSTPAALVERIVSGAGPEETGDFEAEVARLREGVVKGNNALEAKALWLYRMLYSPHPLRERLTLFWHNHFATSNAKVRSLRLIQQQNETLRRHALGRFDALLAEMTIDPAMLIWLDSDTNKKNAPNENYAREVMELFSLGVGHYTEKDIQEAARALTGWKVVDDRATFDPAQFDDSDKTVFGQTGRWTSGDVVRQCLSQRACAQFLVRKLFRELVSETAVPSDALLEPLAAGFRARNYDIAWLVGTMLRSNAFFSAAAIRQKVKSPCDFLLGMVLALEGRPSLTQLAQFCDQLGQSLLYPPSVKGWDGGPAWINSSTLLKRQNLAFELTRGSGQSLRIDPARLPAEYGVVGAEKTAEFFLRLFHQEVAAGALMSIVSQIEAERAAGAAAFYGDLRGQGDLSSASARSAAHLALTLPEYQLG